MAKATALAAAIGATVAAIWGAGLGAAVQGLVIATAGFVAAVSVHEHHATIRNANNAAVAVGQHESTAHAIEQAVGKAMESALPAIAALAPSNSGVPSAAPVAVPGPSPVAPAAPSSV